MAVLSPPLLPIAAPSASSSFSSSAAAVAAFPARSSRRPARRSDGCRLLGAPGKEKVAPLDFLLRAASSSSSSSSSPMGPGGGILGDVAIYSALTGEPVLFHDLWEQNEGMAVVALLRHFGCPCCWELASILRDAKSRLDSAGVKLIAVGVGTPDKARILAERLPFPLDCLYADPDRKAYDVLGLYYGWSRTFFNPASTKVFSRFESLRKATENYTIAATPDESSSVLQQGGMFVFKGTQLLYARKDEGTGDHAPLEDVLNVCCKVPVP